MGKVSAKKIIVLGINTLSKENLNYKNTSLFDVARIIDPEESLVWTVAIYGLTASGGDATLSKITVIYPITS